MATAYYKRIHNTVVSGTQLQSYLSGEDLRALEFDANATVTPIVSLTTAAPVVTLTPEQWVQAAVSSLPVNNVATSGAPLISLGVDAGSQASQYLNFFNINTGSELRVLRFLQLSSNASAAVNLGSGGAGTNVKVTSVYGGTAAPTQILFGSTTSNAHLPGNETLVLVTGTPSATLSSNTVTFNVLAGPL